MSTFFIESSPDVTLEAHWDEQADASRALVFCHPHPLQGGTMNAPLMIAVTKALVTADVAILRFNFRGVGESTGTHDHGDGEQQDVSAAVAHAEERYPELPLSVAGWSFGAATALRWQASTGSAIPYAGIAPPLAPGRFTGLPGTGDLAPADRRVILGDRDQFTSIAEAETYVAAIGARLDVMKGSDHFFYFRETQVAKLVAAAISAETEPTID